MATTLPDGPSAPGLLQTARFVARPMGFLDDCRRRYGDVFTLTLPPVGRSVFLAAPADVKKVFSLDRVNVMNPGRKFLLEPILGRRSVLLQVGAEHLRRRKLMLPPFHGERMRGYETLMEEVTREAVARWPRGAAFPLLPEMREITLDVILRAVFGLHDGARAVELREALRSSLAQADSAGMQLTFSMLPRDLRARHPVGRGLAEIDRLLAAEIGERRAAPDLEEREDILSMLLLARDEDGEPLDDAEMRDQLMTLLVAGHETTATGLAWAFDALFRTPARARAPARGARRRRALPGRGGRRGAARAAGGGGGRPAARRRRRARGRRPPGGGDRRARLDPAAAPRPRALPGPLAFRPERVPRRLAAVVRLAALRRRDAPLPGRRLRPVRDAGRPAHRARRGRPARRRPTAPSGSSATRSRWPRKMGRRPSSGPHKNAAPIATVSAVTATLADLPLLASGKVREMYDLGDRLLMVASDRISTYDAIHPNGIPDKGKVLTGLSAFWFAKTGHIVPNHFVSATDGVPDEARGRAIVARKLEMLPVECVVRGYIAGSGWKDYQATGAVCGHRAAARPARVRASCRRRSSRRRRRPRSATTTRRSTSTAPPSWSATAS